MHDMTGGSCWKAPLSPIITVDFVVSLIHDAEFRRKLWNSVFSVRLSEMFLTWYVTHYSTHCNVCMRHAGYHLYVRIRKYHWYWRTSRIEKEEKNDSENTRVHKDHCSVGVEPTYQWYYSFDSTYINCTVVVIPLDCMLALWLASLAIIKSLFSAFGALRRKKKRFEMCVWYPLDTQDIHTICTQTTQFLPPLHKNAKRCVKRK